MNETAASFRVWLARFFRWKLRRLVRYLRSWQLATARSDDLFLVRVGSDISFDLQGEKSLGNYKILK